MDGCDIDTQECNTSRASASPPPSFALSIPGRVAPHQDPPKCQSSQGGPSISAGESSRNISLSLSIDLAALNRVWISLQCGARLLEPRPECLLLCQALTAEPLRILTRQNPPCCINSYHVYSRPAGNHKHRRVLIQAWRILLWMPLPLSFYIHPYIDPHFSSCVSLHCIDFRTLESIVVLISGSALHILVFLHVQYS